MSHIQADRIYLEQGTLKLRETWIRTELKDKVFPDSKLILCFKQHYTEENSRRIKRDHARESPMNTRKSFNLKTQSSTSLLRVKELHIFVTPSAVLKTVKRNSSIKSPTFLLASKMWVQGKVNCIIKLINHCQSKIKMDSESQNQLANPVRIINLIMGTRWLI